HLTSAFPSREMYSLTDQMRRAAVSVASNIAEGQAHYSRREFIHFLRHARGSLAELETQLLISQRLDYVQNERVVPVLKRVEEVNRILSGLINSLHQSKSAA
ncbi:MAG TPA: four helix bundle protein, partial [Terriglobales bacterium]|nr:four helix bundle protein [Terriglobales bacterium]